METNIKTMEFCCPKCRNYKKTEIEIRRTLVEEFNFSCECGCEFKYQYENISCNGEMSTYKNKYTNSIMIEVNRIVRQLYDEMRLDTTKR